MNEPLNPDRVQTRAEVIAEKEALSVDARNRALRTFLQGLGLDLLTAVAAAVLLWLPDADLSSQDAWLVLGTGLVRTVMQTAFAYIMRLKLDGSAVPTPLPPTPQPEPADPVVPGEVV